jgi:hypothetical protein
MATKKRPSTVRRRNSSNISVLPLVGREGKPPPWPLPDPPTKQQRERWATEWAKPVAVVWEQWRCEHLVARYVRLAVRAEAPGASERLQPEVRHLESELGLSPLAVFRLQWTLADAPPISAATDLDAYRKALGQ